MIFPLYSLGAFGYEASLVAGTLIGFAFGFVLERAGFGRAPVLAAQFYFADTRVLKVMFGAIVTALLGTTILAGAGVLDFSLLTVPETFLWPQLAGGLLLGVGFIVSGYCPGTAVVAAGSGNLDGVMTVGGVMAGSLLYGVFHPWVAEFELSGAMGVVRLPDLLGVPQALLAAGVAAMAAGMFLGGEALERLVARRHGGGPLLSALPRNWVFIGIALASLGGIATLAREPPAPASAPAPEAVPIDSLTLARTLIESPDSVRVVDVRDPAACAAKRIPGAMCLPADDPGGAFLADLPPTRRLVLYGATDLRSLPAPAARFGGSVLVLAGGFAAFESAILAAPVAPSPVTPEALARFRLLSALHAKFTGASAAPPPPPAAPTKARPRGAKKGGGC
ncbi:MAG: YeeE/YedE family protein [Deltaproteobacteria bacterium]|nr:YeeE/YedE family protein [Deltaproteobacteria bacterium]